MAIKLLMTWDIIPGREQDYFEFMVREFVPAVQQLGLEPTGAWVTVYGDQPRIQTVAQTESIEELRAILHSQEWDALIDELMDYVEDLEFKAVRARPGFQL